MALSHIVTPWDDPASLSPSGMLGAGMFSGMTMQDFEDLQKALDAGTPDPTYEGGGAGWPLITQSIEGSLTWATAKEYHARLWKQLPKDPKRLTSTVHEFSSITGLGPNVDFAMPEGSAGSMIESDLTRNKKFVRFMSHKRSISDPMNQLTNLVGGSPAIEQMNQWASTWMVLQLEAALFWGDSSINPYAIDGLAAICKAQNRMVDMRGAPLTGDAVYDVLPEMINAPSYGHPTDLWISVQSKTDFARLGGTHIRWDVPQGLNGTQSFRVGADATGIISPLGDTVAFQPSIFLDSKKGPGTVAIGDGAPATPTGTLALSTDAATKFTADDYGVYGWKVRACGVKGKSAPCTLASGTIDGTHTKATYTIAAPGTDNVLYYECFRTKAGGTGLFEVRRIPQTRSGDGSPAATLFVDMNEDIPDSYYAFALENTPEVWQWKQLLDFARVALPRDEYRQVFGYALYGLLIPFLPLRFYGWKNIGRAS